MGAAVLDCRGLLKTANQPRIANGLPAHAFTHAFKKFTTPFPLDLAGRNGRVGKRVSETGRRVGQGRTPGTARRVRPPEGRRMHTAIICSGTVSTARLLCLAFTGREGRAAGGDGGRGPAGTLAGSLAGGGPVCRACPRRCPGKGLFRAGKGMARASRPGLGPRDGVVAEPLASFRAGPWPAAAPCVSNRGPLKKEGDCVSRGPL